MLMRSWNNNIQLGVFRYPEEIIEFQLGVDIVPLPGLQKVIEIEGFTSSDLRNIYVDEFVYENRLARYRFTLAHEVGHIVLHQHIYRKTKFKNSQEWMTFINSIPDNTHRWLEYQAYAFGGLILVPLEHLQKLTCNYVKRVDEEGISISDNCDFAWEYIAAQLAKDFNVSASVIEKRLQKEEIKERYR